MTFNFEVYTKVKGHCYYIKFDFHSMCTAKNPKNSYEAEIYDEINESMFNKIHKFDTGSTICLTNMTNCGSMHIPESESFKKDIYDKISTTYSKAIRNGKKFYIGIDDENPELIKAPINSLMVAMRCKFSTMYHFHEPLFKKTNIIDHT